MCAFFISAATPNAVHRLALVIFVLSKDKWAADELILPEQLQRRQQQQPTMPIGEKDGTANVRNKARGREERKYTAIIHDMYEWSKWNRNSGNGYGSGNERLENICRRTLASASMNYTICVIHLSQYSWPSRMGIVVVVTIFFLSTFFRCRCCWSCFVPHAAVVHVF